jgi:S-formylglutathione hydrolase FrmB
MLPARLLLTVAIIALSAPAQIRFEVTLAKDLQPKASGRLLLFMSHATEKRNELAPGFVPGETWIAARKILALPSGQSVIVNPDETAYPKPFSQAPSGHWQFMALLDTDHNYAYHGRDGDDLLSEVVALDDINPATLTEPVRLELTRRIKARVAAKDTDTIRLVEMESRLLSEFWGRPIVMRAGVVLPPQYAQATEEHYPAVYEIHGFGGDYRGAWMRGPLLTAAIKDGKRAPMVHVFLDGSCPGGHHEFADSLNNGPWGKALTEEFIPYLERRFRLVAEPYGRFLTGHSSGGWSTLWLQVTYPGFFGGTWSTAPDPVDLRSFTGIDVSPGASDNFYRDGSGKARNLVRQAGKELATVEDFVKQEEVTGGSYGGQMRSFEWVWSPRGADGEPMQLFNRATGEQDPEVQKAWRKYDIRLILKNNWEWLGPRLRSKLVIVCGKEDTFHLEQAVIYLCDFLKEAGSDAVCEIVPGRDHMNLYRAYETYPDGLDVRFDKQMYAKFQAGVARTDGSGPTK